MRLARRLGLTALLAICLGTGSCTLCKPFVGALTGPVIFLGHSSGDFGGCGCDARAAACAFVVFAAVGAVAGLVTGVVSDVQVLRGRAHDPCNNWWDPFATNTGESTGW